MANNNFVVNSAQFMPLSFDDYMKPLALLNEQHQKLDDAYLELYTKASTIEQMANEQTDPEAYRQYKAYADDLRSAIDTLDKNGLTPNSRRQMLLMARRYGDEVAPIQGAYTRRAADIEKQREALLKDQTIRFSRKAQDSSLMDYMKDPSLSYESMSGAAITADVANKVKNLKNKLLSGTGEWKKTLGGQQFERILQYGLTPEIMYDIMQNPDNYPMFKDLIESAVDASGVGAWGTEDDINYAIQQAYSGLWEGIGTDGPEIVENKDLDRAHKALQIARTRDEMNNPEKYGHKSTGSGSKNEKIEGRHYNQLSPTVSKFESERLRRRNSDIEFIQSLQKSKKDLKEKDRAKLSEIERLYGINAYKDENGNMNYNDLMNRIASLSNERMTSVYESNLTDSSTILNIIGRDARAGYHPKNGEVKDSDMDLIFTPTGKKWEDIQKGKINGVAKTSMDIMNDILNDKNSKISIDPISGIVYISQTENSELGDIILYDRSRDNGKSRVLNNQTFSTNIFGRKVDYKFAELIDTLSDIARYDRLSARDLQKMTGMNPADLSNDDIAYLNSLSNEYAGALREAFFSGIVGINNAVSPSHSQSGEAYNTSIFVE